MACRLTGSMAGVLAGGYTMYHGMKIKVPLYNGVNAKEVRRARCNRVVMTGMAVVCFGAGVVRYYK